MVNDTALSEGAPSNEEACGGGWDRMKADEGRLSFQMLVTAIAPASRIALSLAPSSSPSGV